MDFDFTKPHKIVNGVPVLLTEGEITARAAEEAAFTPQPDVPGFIRDLKMAMGGIVASNLLAKAYPLFYPALTVGNFPDVQALIVDAHTAAVLNDTQYAAFKSLAAKHNIPITLP